MITSRTSIPSCPICHRSSTVKPVAVAYETGTHLGDRRFAPPVEPVERSFLLWPITWGVILETVTLIAVMVLCASGNFSIWQYWLAIVGICLPLVLSVYGFRRLLDAENRSLAQRTWDEARAKWDRLQYCAADDLFFDPTAQQAASSEGALAAPGAPAPSQVVGAIAAAA